MTSEREELLRQTSLSTSGDGHPSCDILGNNTKTISLPSQVSEKLAVSMESDLDKLQQDLHESRVWEYNSNS